MSANELAMTAALDATYAALDRRPRDIGVDMPHAEYLAAPGLSASALKAGRTSILHMRHWITHKPTSRAMEWGTVVHLAALQPERLLTDVAVWGGCRRAGKEWAEFRDESAGKIIVDNDDVAGLHNITAAVRGCKPAQELLAGCQYERSIFWTDSAVGACKARLDACKHDAVVDLKTTAQIGRATKQAFALGYHLQLAWYCEAMRRLGYPQAEAYIVFVEAGPPYDVRVVRVGYDVLELGTAEATRIATRYRECEAAGVWPGCGADGVEVWNLETWQQPEGPELEGATDAD